MNLATRNLRWHWRTHVAVALGVAAASAALAGALLVGDSMRGSLREAALSRLGTAEFALSADHFLREALADSHTRLAPLILLGGGITHAQSQARVEGVQILGVNDRFWSLSRDSSSVPDATAFSTAGQAAILNRGLAAELGVAVGDEVIVRVGKPAAISTETLLGRRDDTTRSLRLRVTAIVPDAGIGAFALAPRQQVSRNLFVPLATLQRLIEQPGRVNTIISGHPLNAPDGPVLLSFHRDASPYVEGGKLELSDYGLRLRVDDRHGYVSLESDRQLVEPAVEAAARTAAERVTARQTDLFAYLANDIAISTSAASSAPTSSASAGRAIPYSTVVGIGPNAAWPMFATPSGVPISAPNPGELVLNTWAARESRANIGDRVTVTYYVTGSQGELETRTAEFTLSAIVALDGLAADPGFVPDYPGVTDARRMTDWDPPFPIDFKRVTDVDERYWDEHRTTPKAFVNLADAQRLWAEDADRLGRLTAIRFRPHGDQSLAAFAEALAVELKRRLDPATMGVSVIPLRQQALAAAAGNTDFGGLFIGFSFFLIASAAMLVSLLFRLGVERRSKELGLLTALGFTRGRLRWLLLAEGALVAIVGTLLGLLLAPLYAARMLAGLRSWWSGAVNAPFLSLHIAPGTLEISAAASVILALLSITWAIGGVLRASPRTLLAGAGRSERLTARRPWSVWSCLSIVVTMCAAVIGVVLWLLPTSETIAFFLIGATLLGNTVGCAGILLLYAHRAESNISAPGPRAWLRLGLRNARRNPIRSLLTIGLIASAAFLITALGAFKLEADPDPYDRSSGTGGFTLYAEAASPLPYDLNTPAGRDALGISPDAEQVLQSAKFIPFRLRPGDASSCLNLYSGTRRRILGATDFFIARGDFAFSASLAATPEERANPWLLLNRRPDDRVIHAIGDEAAVKWQLHSGLGQDLQIEGAHGETVRLRFVALLSNSALQDELIVSEAEFLRLFPRTAGYAFFLIDTPPGGPDATAVENALERTLAPFALDAAATTTRIAAYNRVQNTYLATFQTLGGFGLILGVIGLSAVLLRNVWERRGELALLTAVGFSRFAVGCVVLAENAALLIAGLLAGVLPALVAIAPQLATRPSAVPWPSLAGTLIAVFLVGMFAGVVALIPVLRTPPLRALRAE